MSRKYHILPSAEGWIVRWIAKGVGREKTFKTKDLAIAETKRKMSKEPGSQMIVHSKDGKVMSVHLGEIGYKVKSANVKHRLNNKSVRNIIAKVMYQQQQ